MSRSLALLLLAPIALPVLTPLASLVASPESWSAWAETGRLLSLAENTFRLTFGTLAVTLPAGVLIATLLYRSNLPAVRCWRVGLILVLFVPLPLTATAWQSAFGGHGWQPWDHGVGPAIAVHSLAALPWVIWLIGLGLVRVEREYEELARLTYGPIGTFFRVTLPRSAPTIGLAAMWVAVQTGTEIVVTDLMLVRTFAEEVYTQFVGSGEGLARTAAVSLPWSLTTGLIAFVLVTRWERRWVTSEGGREPVPLYRFGRVGRVVVSLVLLVTVMMLAGVPLAGLVWRAGGGHVRNWDAIGFLDQVAAVPEAHGWVIVQGLFWAGVAGLVAASVALIASWVGRASGPWRVGLFVLAVLAWTLPGPVIGFGLKQVIDAGMDLEEALLGAAGPFRAAFYDGPSPLPLVWVEVVRMFPFALAIVWPAVRGVPRDQIEMAQTEGASEIQQIRHVVWPGVRGHFWVAVVAVAVLSLGEVSAGKLVQTPGYETFAQVMFDQMHYGVGAELAAMCLWQVAVTATVVGVLFVLATRSNRFPVPFSR